MSSTESDILERRPLPQGVMAEFIRWLGSLQFTLWVLLYLSLAVGWLVWRPGMTAFTLTPPMLLLFLNLLAAIWIQPRFRTHPALLVFHLALLFMVALATLGHLTYLKGELELSVGGEFEGELTGFKAGPWHPWHLDRTHFVNLGFEVEYEPGPSRTYTRNQVSWSSNGEEHHFQIGDRIPLVREGYRFYTTSNKGFAPIISWTPKGREEILGDLHMPSYPSHKLRQTSEWTPPYSTRKLWFQLAFDEEIIKADQASRFRPPSEHTLVVRDGDTRFELAPGERAVLSDGVLHYRALGTWMGYDVFYDWTRPWLVATCLIAIAAMGWHFWTKYRRQSWLQEG